MAQVDADERRLVVKKLFVKLSLAFIIIAALVLIWLGFRPRDLFVPSYQFLAGQYPIECKKANRRIEDSKLLLDRRYIYSFEADFNDICLKADAELIPAGFVAKGVVQILSCNEYRERVYWLKERFPRGPVWIVIQNNREYRKHPDSKKGAINPKDGWVVVMITYWRSWRWPF